MSFVKKLGHGAFGIVSLYKNTCGEHVVVKKLRTKHFKSSNAYIMFKNEGRILSNLTHDNIRALYDFTEDRMTLEYCKGCDMFDYLGALKLKLSYETIIHLFMQLVDAIHYIHSKNIAHLDIKLENIMIDTETNKIKLIDFGHATDTETISNLGGTHPYIAPEGFSKTPIIAVKADIWSLGIILYEFITSTIPWEFSNKVDSTFFEYSRTNDLYLNDITTTTTTPVILTELLKDTLTIDPAKRITSDKLLSKMIINKYAQP
jgi:serine/threonine protein kinase